MNDAEKELQKLRDLIESDVLERALCPQCLALWEARRERSAIMEYDGGLPRKVAERRAVELHPDRRTCGHG